MGIDCYCNFRSEPGSIPVPQLDNSANNNKKFRKNNSQSNDQDVDNKISFNNTNEQKLEKNEDINNNDINNNDNDNNSNSNNQIYNNLTESEFEKTHKLQHEKQKRIGEKK